MEWASKRERYGKVKACMNSICYVLIKSLVMSIQTKLLITKEDYNWHEDGNNWYKIEYYEGLCHMVDGELPPILAKNGSTEAEISTVSVDAHCFSYLNSIYIKYIRLEELTLYVQ